jgi:HAD superfamily hydrolase (TIGR01509 family)
MSESANRDLSPAARPPVLLFDVMSTLVYDPFHEALPGFFDLSLRELIEQVQPGTWVQFELGAIDEAAALARMFRDGRDVDREALIAMLRSTYRWLPGMEALVGELRAAGVVMHVLSNYPTWYRLIEAELRLSRYLPWTFVSCHTGVRKPSAQAYLGPAQHLGRPASELLLIDDQPVNCEAAKKLGIDALRFRDARELRGELRSRRLL